MDKRSRKAKSKATERQEEPADGATHDVARSVSPKRGVTPTPDWLLTFLAHQEERDAKREERHEATMHMLCEAFSRRSRHTSPAGIVNEQSTENNTVGGETAPITQRAFSGTRAKARAPEQMPADITLRDLSAWRRSWDDFAELEQLDRLPVSQQRAMLRTHLTVEMRAVLQLAIGIDNDDASSVSEILDAIHGYVRSKRNVTLDRVALEERRQEEGETFDEYYIALREIANNADLCKVCMDDRLTTRIMSGIREPETKRKLLAHTPPPSLPTTLNICRSEECAHNDELTLANRSTKETVLICKGQRGFLLAWYVCRDLGIIPNDYPKQVCAMKHTCSQLSRPKNVTEHTTPPKSSRAKHTPLNTMDASDRRSHARKELLEEFNDVFNTSDELKTMTGEPMKIHLKEDVETFAISTTRSIPFAWRDEVKENLDRMTRQGIVKPLGDSPTRWCHPLVVVPKSKGGVRLCVDLTKLNTFVRRPIHPMKTPKEAVSNIKPGSQYFSTLDATQGYWQIALSQESQELTTFLTPWGRYLFLRSPMGLSSTGDEYCRRGDIAIAGLSNVEKVMDDVIVFDDNFDQHVDRVRALLLRCREHGITLNPDKFKFAEKEVKFVGFTINAQGVSTDPDKLKAIAEFPIPSCLTDLRSFMGLINQLGDFTTEVSTTADPLRELLKTKNEFRWTETHTTAFQATKKALVTAPTLAHYDPSKPTALHTDGSRRKGLGYALLQKHADKWRLIQCGSRFLTETESRYAMVELELLAATWAMKKCRIHLLGLEHFELVVDHKALVTILDKHRLDDVDNTRLQRLKEKTALFSFTTRWTKGKDHCIPNALSRAPVSDPLPEDQEAEEELEHHVHAITINSSRMTLEDDIDDTRNHLRDPTLDHLRAVALSDDNYKTLIHNVENGFPTERNKADANVAPFWNIRNELSVDDGIVLYGPRIVVPKAARREVLARLHDSHQGVERTKRSARQSVYWPGINNDISTTVASCDKCQELLPSQQREPLKSEPLPTRVFEDVSADFFSYAGRDYLVYVDRLSGWPVTFHFAKGNTTSRHTINACRRAFVALGVPVRFRSDGAPQFASREFRQFLKRWGVNAVLSTPHYPQSNGLAEAAVKVMKKLIATTTVRGELDDENFQRGLLEYRNTPREGGLSPAQILFGHPLRSAVPAHRASFSDKWQKTANEYDARRSRVHAQHEERYNTQSRSLQPLHIGAEVRVQHPTTKKWDRVGVIIGIGQNRDYHVKLPSGRVYWRNRRFLRSSYGAPPNEDATNDEPGDIDHDGAPTCRFQPPDGPRRSNRRRMKPKTLNL